jgi:hypothetical protein
VIFLTLLACHLLFGCLQQLQNKGGRLQYTIEARELTNGAESRRTVVMAKDADEAIHRYVLDREAELVSFSQPARGQESIATVKKQDAVFLVRVYAA